MRLALSLACAVLALGCGSSLPRPPRGEPPWSAFAEVPTPPPPARVERVPERPSKTAVWVDGSYEWTGTRWRWVDGGWFERPANGILYADWAFRRSPTGDTRLYFASAAWRDGRGDAVPGPRRLASASMNNDTPDASTGDVVSDASAGEVVSEASPADATGSAITPHKGGNDASL